MPQPRTPTRHPAIKALEDEIAAIEKGQQPTRDQIAELEASLREGQQVIARNRAAIEVLEGKVAITPATPRARRVAASSGGVTASQISDDRIIDFLGANQPARALDIGAAIGVTGNPLSVKLKRMVDDGKLTYEGERRQRAYSLKTG